MACSTRRESPRSRMTSPRRSRPRWRSPSPARIRAWTRRSTTYTRTRSRSGTSSRGRPPCQQSVTCRRSTTRCRRRCAATIACSSWARTWASTCSAPPAASSMSSARSGSATRRSPRPGSPGPLLARRGVAGVGMRPVVDLMLSSFMYVAMDQIISIISKSTYLYGGQASLPLTIRASMFYGGSNAAQHSDRPLALFMASPGLKIVAPSTPYDAKGLIKAAIREDDPVIVFEDGTLWTSTGEVPDGDYVVPLGQADVKREGSNVTVVVTSGAVQPAAGGGGRRSAVAGPDGLRHDPGLGGEDRAPGGRRPVAPHLQPGRRDRRHRGRGRVLVTAGADRPGHRAGHAHPVQPAARAAALPEC